MSTSTLGAGAAPAGASYAGFGSPATADAPSPHVPGAARKIYASTRDYNLEDDGNFEQTTSAEQSVYLAIASIDDWPAVISDSYAADVEARVRASLESLTSAGLIEIRSVQVGRDRATRTRLRVIWRDTSTGEEFTNGV